MENNKDYFVWLKGPKSPRAEVWYANCPRHGTVLASHELKKSDPVGGDYSLLALINEYPYLGEEQEKAVEMEGTLQKLQLEFKQMREMVKKLLEEIEVLRAYGNKDCTAQADAELERRASIRSHLKVVK